MNRFHWGKALVKVTIAVAALAGIILLQRSQLNLVALRGENPKQAEQQEALRLKLLKQTPTFGFDNLLADWVFLNFLQYFGDQPAREKTGYDLSPEYLDLVTRRDPRFVDVYIFISNSVSYQLGQPQLAIQLMKRGTVALSPRIDPKSFQLWRFMGLDQLLLLGDIPGSIYSHEMAAKWVAGTPYQDYASRFQQTAHFLRSDPNSRAVRVSAWGSIYAQAAMIGDQKTQERAKQEILALGGKLSEQDGKLYIGAPSESPAKKP
ncbi:MAG: hypothetical protein HC866_03935 [Leptolyngbyaceae cyanobacterium RU_5_1]|nr:hypothetical protein [Leptolyngbyaceae cyanobacterium RU_5_1]